jgi:Pretoxin HINT domain
MSGVRSILTAGILAFGGLAAWGADATPAPTLKAATPRDSKIASPGDHYVHEALAAELAGDEAGRDELLAQALLADPNCRSARWQSGYASVGGKWLTTDEAAAKFSADRDLNEYRHRREQAASAGLLARGAVAIDAGGTEEGKRSAAQGASVETYRTGSLTPEGIAANAELARWCRTKRLTDEERAHWTQVLLEDRSNREAQSRLGMRWYMRSLLTNAQIDALKKRRALEERQLMEWKPIVVRWQKELDAGSGVERAEAATEMQDVSDPAVIPALEWAVYSDSPKPPAKGDAATPFQRQAIALLGRLPEQRATYSLAMHAALAPQSKLRATAAEELKKRPLHDFVPILLSGLANPIQFDYAMTFDRGAGMANYRAVASQEGRDTIRQVEYSSSATGLFPSVNIDHHVFVNQTKLVDFTGKKPTVVQTTKSESGSQSWSPGPSDLSEVAGAAALARQTQLFESSVDDQNARIEHLNQRISSVLEKVATNPSTASSDQPSVEAEAIPDSALVKQATSMADYWWNWWADYNELPTPYKQTSVTRYSNDYNRSNRDQFSYSYMASSGTVTYNAPKSYRHCNCFAAGTPVLTLTGPQAIEKLQIGDRVLAQDPDTGELAYKPVLATSKSPPAKLLRATTSRGTVRMTLGHPFWVEGKGWRMAKELHMGDRIHALHGIAVVMAIESQPMEPVYNLNVADFGTYFVSDGQLLVHDFTPRLPSRALLPGFAADGR